MRQTKYTSEDYLKGRDDALREVGRWLLMRIDMHREMRKRALMKWTEKKINIYIDAYERAFEQVDFMRTGQTEDRPTRRQSSTELKAVLRDNNG